MIYRTASHKIITDYQFSPVARCILFLLYIFMNEEGVAFPSREKILNCLGISKNGFYKHYRQLEAGGLITVDRKKCSVNRYHPQWKRPAGKGKYGIVYKDIMVNPGISPTAKLLYVYITVFCPYNRSWNFKKSFITGELHISTYQLSKSLKELEYFNLITCEYKLYEVTITNTFQSESFKKRGHHPSKKEDTTLEKKGHDPSKKEDREENKSIETSLYQSNLNKNEGETETDGEKEERASELEFADTEIKEIQIIDCKKIHLYYLQILLKNSIKGWYASELRKVLECHQITLSQFAEQFLRRYEQKTANTTIRSIHSHMKVCLGEFIGNYDLLSTEGQKVTKGYPATYDIEEYETTSVFDELSEEEREEFGIAGYGATSAYSENCNDERTDQRPTSHTQHTTLTSYSRHIQAGYDIEEYESSSVLDDFDFEMECVDVSLQL